MLEDKVKNLLLVLATVNAVIFEYEGNQATIVNNTMEESR